MLEGSEIAKGDDLSEAVVTEISEAQRHLPSLSRQERRRLLHRIMDEIKSARSCGLSNGMFQDVLSLERLIVSTCYNIAEIAEMDDAGFRRVLEEFCKLIITMNDLVSPPASGRITIH